MVNGWIAALCIVGAPTVLFVLLVAMARFEARAVAPDERAEHLSSLLTSTREPEAVEQLAATVAEQALPPDPRRAAAPAAAGRTGAKAWSALVTLGGRAII